jgi:thiol-disulfide isomerase/thioredoxin
MKAAWQSTALALLLSAVAFPQAAPAPTAPSPGTSSEKALTFDQEMAAGKQDYAEGKDSAAAAHFDKALSLAKAGKERAGALLYLGVVFVGGGKMGDAETALRTAVAQDPSCTECGFNLGYVLLKESKDAEGVAALKAVLPQLKGTPREREVERFIADPTRARKDFAPEFSLRAANGEPINLDTLHGKVVLLDFWGAWCHPCRQTVPLLKQLAQGFDPTKVAIVSVDEYDSREVWSKFVQDNGMTWPQARDEDGSLKRAFGVEGFPFSVMLSQDGIILRKFKGWGPGWEAVMREEIEKALKNSN